MLSSATKTLLPVSYTATALGIMPERVMVPTNVCPVTGRAASAISKTAKANGAA